MFYTDDPQILGVTVQNFGCPRYLVPGICSPQVKGLANKLYTLHPT